MNLVRSLASRYTVTQNPLKSERRLELVVAVLVFLMCLWVFLGFAKGVLGGAPSAVPPAEDSLAVKSLKLDEPLSPDLSSAMLARPLFWEERRPVVEAPKAAVSEKPKTPPPPKKLEGVKLHGVFGAGDALGIIATVDGKMGRIKTGEAVKGWRLLEYSDGKAIFENSGSRSELPLALTTPNVRVVPTSADANDSSGSDGEEQKDETADQGPGLTFGGGSSRPRPRRKQ